jgi:CBS domain-containing protein
MVTHRVSGLPVVDHAGRVVGIVSEGDLIVRQKAREPRPWWHGFLEDSERLAREYRKRTGSTVGEVMTASVLCVSPRLPIESAALVLDERRVRRLPVVDGERLVGIVSRGDLVRALAQEPLPRTEPRSGTDLVQEVKDRLAAEGWVTGRGIVVEARDGVLWLWGLVESEAERAAVETLARSIEGVTGVQDHLVVRRDLPYLYGA